MQTLPSLQGLTQPDELKRIIEVYRQACETYETIFDLAQKMETSLQTIDVQYPYIGKNVPIYRVINDRENTKRKLREKTWKGLIERTGLLERPSNQRERQMERYIVDTYELEVNQENVLMVLEQIIQTWEPIHEELLLEAFKYLTRDARNRVGRRGKYATNDAYAVGEKVIVSRPNRFESYNGLHDVDKALCYLTGGSYEYQTCTVVAINDAANKKGPDESQFFLFKVYSETVHLRWKDEALRVRFNQRVGDLVGRGLPGEIKR